MRRWWIGVGIVVAAALGAGSARACLTCGPELVCAWAPAGGRWCLSGNAVCMLGGACRAGAAPALPGDDSPSFQVSFLAAPEGAGFAAARVIPDAGPVSTGRNALRIARQGRQPEWGVDRIVFTGQGVAGSGTAVLRARTGDGFTIAIERDGAGTRAKVCALAGDGPGRELANERLEANDALVVPVPFEGRPVLLVLQAAMLPVPEAHRRGDEALRATREAMAGRAQPARPPFELRVLDR